MTARKIVLTVMLLMGAVALGGPSSSFAAVNVDIRIAPPAAPVEVIPGPRAGFVWVSGVYEWRGERHVWVAGHWVRERRGFHWVPAHWDRRGDLWHFEPGHWAR
jgi:hypothetical protein